MKIVSINKAKPNKTTTIAGFVVSVRIKTNIIFLVIKDLTSSMQITILKQDNPSLFAKVESLTVQSYLTVTGMVKKNENVKLNGVEMIPSAISIDSLSSTPLPLDTTSLIDQRLDYRWLDLRNERNQLIFKVRTTLAQGFRKYLLKNNYIEINSPKLIAAASESGSEVFEISNYFGKKAYLAQSPQFYKQMAISGGFEKVFEMGPVFRAENSHTTKHCTEFEGFDLEAANLTSVYDLMKIEEEMIIAGLKDVKKAYGNQIKELFGQEVIVPKKMPIMNLKDVFAELSKRYNFNVPADQQGDLGTEAEKMTYQLAKDMFGSEFLFVIGYDKKDRPFYHHRDENGIPQGFDLIYRGVEITSGAIREHQYDTLLAQAKEKGVDKDIQFYLQFFKYGIPPHGGFGMGFDRIVMLILNINIREATLCYRGPERLNP